MNRTYILLSLVCLAPSLLSGTILEVAPLTTIRGTGSMMSDPNKLASSTASSFKPSQRDSGVTSRLKLSFVPAAKVLGRLTMAAGTNDNSKLVRTGATNKIFETADKAGSTYKEEAPFTDGDLVCRKNPVRVAFEKFMDNLSASYTEQTDIFNGCDNGSSTMPNVLKDFLNFTGHVIKPDWHDVLSGPTKPYISLMQRLSAWSKDYDALKRELEEEQKNNRDQSTVDPAYIVMQMASKEVLKINYARIDKMFADTGREKLIEDAKKEQIPSDTSLRLIDSSGQINTDYLNRLLLHEEGMDYLLDLGSKVIKTLEDNLVANKKLHEDYLKEKGINNGAEEVEHGDELVRNQFKDDNCLENMNIEEKLIADKLNSIETIRVNDSSSGSEQRSGCVAEAQFAEGMNRLARVAKGEIIRAIKDEVIILAQFYFISALGFNFKPNVLEAYMCTIKGRLLGKGFFFLIDNVPGLRRMRDRAISSFMGACGLSRAE